VADVAPHRTSFHIGYADVPPRQLKQPTKPLREQNGRFGQLKDVKYLVLWLKVKNQITPIDEGCGKDFFQGYTTETAK
jgi:hypothetical protein